MDSGGDGTTPGPASAMRVEETWGLTQAEETGYGPRDRMVSFETSRSGRERK